MLIYRLIRKAKKQTSTISTSAEARYSSGAQFVKLSEDSQPPSSRPTMTNADYDSNLFEADYVQMSNTQEEYGGEYERF